MIFTGTGQTMESKRASRLCRSGITTIREVETNTQALTLTPEGPQAVGHTAPNLSVITIDVDMEGDTEVAGTQDATVTTSGY